MLQQSSITREKIINQQSHRIAPNFKSAIAHKRGERPELSIFRAPLPSKD